MINAVSRDGGSKGSPQKVAAIQMVSTPDVDENLSDLSTLVAQVASAGAELVVLPENFPYMGGSESGRVALAEADGTGPIQSCLSSLARQHRVWLIGGTVPISVPNDEQRAFASCLVYSPSGERASRYDKIHLFDVDIPGRDEKYRESAAIMPGNDPIVVETDVGVIGLSVCYDLRFPEMYRALQTLGAEILVVPSAFTHETGHAHWEVLLRARAIENQCYVIAANQGGQHAGGRVTWGHSMIIDPWGRVLATAATGAGYAIAEVDRQALAYTRQSFPCLKHRKIGL